MTPRRLILRSLGYFWRTNAAVVLGVATAVAVLGGALVVGDSVRGTLRDLAMQRLGRTDLVVASPGWFREAVAEQLGGDADFRRRFNGICPLAVIPGIVTDQTSGRRAGTVMVYGVDDRFWRFHGVAGESGPDDRDALVSAALAHDAGLATGSIALVRVRHPSAVPLESLHGRKDSVGRTLRLKVSRVLSPADLGEFSLQPVQGPVRAVFVPLRRLQAELEVGQRVNTLLVSGATRAETDTNLISYLLKNSIRADDVGFRVRPLPERRAVSVESDAGLIDAPRLAAVNAAFETTLFEPQPVLTYLANTIQIRERTLPYSLVTATDLHAIALGAAVDDPRVPPPIVLNDWAARDLRARVGDSVRLEYYVWEDAGRLGVRNAEFRLAAIVPANGLDRDFAPVFRGISDAPTVEAWDPPFPIDLRRIRRVDEEYWTKFRTTPKAFVSLAAGQRLWASRFGTLTSVRFRVLEAHEMDASLRAFASRLDGAINPAAFGISTSDVHDAAAAAARGATDLGAYFLYFSIFLVVAAIVLAALFFKLGIEQRVREVGLLRAVGVGAPLVRGLFVAEAAALAGLGAALGAAGAVGYAWLVLAALRTIWIGAVGTTALTLHVSSWSLVAGAVGGLLAAVVCTVWTLRGLKAISERRLLAGDISSDGMVDPSARHGEQSSSHRLRSCAIGGGLVGGLLAAAGAFGLIGQAAAFFGAGSTTLVAGLCGGAYWYRVRPGGVLTGRGWRPIFRLGVRNAAYRPGRSTLATGVIASAVFLLIAVDAFRPVDAADRGRRSGVGGFDLFVESLLPIAQDLNSADARRDLNLAELEGSSVAAFRLRPGDDASCLNLYAPQSPRILGAGAAFIGEGRFAFQSSLAETDAERANPWLLLLKPPGDGAVPVVADANSMTYILKRKLGEDLVIDAGGRRVRLRFVAALADSLFQRELVMADTEFRALFPDREGFQVWLIDASKAPAPRASALPAAMKTHSRTTGLTSSQPPRASPSSTLLRTRT